MELTYDMAPKTVRMVTTDAAVCAATVCLARYRSTGKERDTESGNDYFGARYYASSMGRFMSPDPSGLVYADPTNPQSFNLYSYAVNNPLKFVDPSGLWHCVWNSATGDQDDKPEDGGASEGDCGDQGGAWTIDSGDDPGDSSETLQMQSEHPGAEDGSGTTSKIANTICGALPSGTIASVSGNGNFVGTSGSLDLVTNLRTGEVTGFFSPGYFAGAATAGGSLTGGYTFGNLGSGNSNFSGGFTGVSGGVGIFAGSVSTSSGGPTAPFSGIKPTASGHVTTVSAGVQTPGRALALNTTYSLPTQLGKYWTLADPVTAIMYAANQACAAAGY
jgi:RHS repeat-associated protein